MPSRPEPRSLAQLLNDAFQRLRTLERHQHPYHRTQVRRSNCVEVYGDGTPQDPFFINPRLNIDSTNQLECTEEGLYVAAGQVVGWDAVVDGTQVASDPERRLFKGIGEACSYLDGLGFESVNIFVRNNHTDYSSSSNLPYTETANWNCPASVHLFSARGGKGGLAQNQEQTGVSWNWATFKPVASGAAFTPPDFYIHSFHQVSIGGYTGTAALRGLYLFRTGLVISGTAWTGAMCSDLYATDSWFDLTGTRTFASNVCSLNQCDVALRNSLGGTATFTLGSTVLTCSKTYLFNGSSSGTTNLSMPSRVFVDIATSSNLQNRTGIGQNSSLNLVLPTSCAGLIRTTDPTAGGHYSISSANNMFELRIEGEYGTISLTGTGHQGLSLDVLCSNLTVGGPAGGAEATQIQAQTDGNVDITGPAQVHLTMVGVRTLTLRGSITGTVINRGATHTSGAWLNGVAMGASSLLIVGGGGAASGTARPYILDASSTHNYIMWPNLGSWPNAGTDSGSNNRIETTPGPSGGPAPANGVDYLVGTTTTSLGNEIVVGTTPGGELGGTWASPTVDTTHSGSAHSDFIAKALADAAGDLLYASAADTWAKLAVGTDGEVLTLVSGLPSWEPSAGGGGSFEDDIGDGTNTDLVVNHALGTRAVHVTVYDNTTFIEPMVTVEHTDNDNVTISFALPPASNAYHVLVSAP